MAMAELESFHGFVLFLVVLCGLAFAYHFALRLPAGLLRLVFVLPLLPIFFLLPWTVRLYHLRAVLSFIFLWTGPSKLLLLCWDAGVDYSASGFLYFVVVVLLPIRVRGLKPKHAAQEEKHPAHFNAFWQFIAIVAILNIYTLRDRLPLSLIYALYGFHIYLGLELVLGGLAKLVQTFFGLESDPRFNNPFMSASLSEFWGKRWNLIVTTILRSTVYNPALLLLKPAQKQKMHESNPNALHASNSSQANTAESNKEKPTLRARALALLATFLVSGLIHELIFYYICKTPATGEVTAFFILHGFATAVEVALRRTFPSLKRMPRTISIFLTLAFVYISAAWLFMPPLIRGEADIRTIAEYHQLQSTLMSLFRR